MNPLVSLLGWSIKGMHKECTRVPLVGLASQFYPTLPFFSRKVGHTPLCGQVCALIVYTSNGVYWEFPTAGEYTIYSPGGAFDIKGCYGTNIYK